MEEDLDRIRNRFLIMDGDLEDSIGSGEEDIAIADGDGLILGEARLQRLWIHTNQLGEKYIRTDVEYVEDHVDPHEEHKSSDVTLRTERPDKTECADDCVQQLRLIVVLPSLHQVFFGKLVEE